MISSTSSATSISQLFSKLDTKNQGYLEKSDLTSIFSQISGNTDSTATDQLFSTLDTNSDGKVTESEFSSTLSKLQDELNSQYDQMRMGGMPPPPPPEDTGFTKDELTSQLDEIGSSDSQRSSLISNVVNNFAAADTNSDGKVTFAEAQAYQQSSSTTTSASTASSTTSNNDTSGSTGNSGTADNQVVMMIMRLMQAYATDGNAQSSSSNFSVAA